MADKGQTAAGDNARIADATRLTADETVSELIAGSTLRLADGSQFALPDLDARRALHFFFSDPKGKELYKQPPRAGSESIAATILGFFDKPFSPTKVGATPAPALISKWQVQSLTIRQFGGLTPFCMEDGTDAQPVPLSFDRPLVAIYGKNGVGKTCLARAVSFLFTEAITSNNGSSLPFAEIINTYSMDIDGAEQKIKLPTIVPMPTSKQWDARKAQLTVPRITTEVVASLVDQTGRKLKLSRTVVENGARFQSSLTADGTSKGSVAEALGVSRLSLDLSAIHMSTLANLQLGQANGLARGVEELTGLRGLGTLANELAPRLSNYLEKTYVPHRERAMEQAVESFDRRAGDLLTYFANASTKPLLPSAPKEIDNGATCEASIKALAIDLEARSRNVRDAVAAAAGIPANEVELKNLNVTLQTSLVALAPSKLTASRLAACIKSFETIEDSNFTTVLDGISSLVERAANFAKVHLNKKVATRRRLYARIGAWLREEHHSEAPNDCPTCLRPLDDSARDPTLDLTVREALLQAQAEEGDLHLTEEQFDETLSRELLELLPQPLRDALKVLKEGPLPFDALPGEWGNEIANNLTQIASKTKLLKQLTDKAGVNIRKEGAVLAKPSWTPTPSLPPLFSQRRISRGLAAVMKLIDVAKWSVTTKSNRDNLLEQLVGTEDVAQKSSDGSLHGEIKAIIALYGEYEPVANGLTVLRDLTTFLEQWRAAKDLAAKATSAAKHLRQLTSLDTLVTAQVGGLIKALNADTTRLESLFYASAGRFGPKLTHIDHDGAALMTYAEQEGTSGPAAEITNASRQRAYLFAFILALIRHVWSKDGGLSLLLLDDPQNLFDEENQVRLASGLVKIVDEGFRPLALSFDRSFIARVSRAGAMNTDAQLNNKVDRRELVSRAGQFNTCRIDPHVDALQVKRLDWKSDRGKDARIVEFCAEARKFVEQTLVVFLNESPEPVFNHPTLSELVARVRALIQWPWSRQSAEPFKGVLKLLPDGDEDKKTLGEALNWSHHFQARDLTQAHAQSLDDMLDEFIRLREECLDILYSWPHPVRMMGKKVHEFPTTKAVNSKPLQVRGLLAASSGSIVPIGEGEASHVVFDPERHITFVAGGSAKWLPPPLGPDTIFIVERNHSPPKAADLVVLWEGDAARAQPGWAKVDQITSQIAISGVPGKFQKVVSAEYCQTHRIVGGLFGGGPQTARGCEPIEIPDLLADCIAVAEITAGVSAEPLFRKGDQAFLGEPIQLDRVDELIDRVVAAQLDDGTQTIKRLARSTVAGCRLLLPISGEGEGMLVAVGEGAPAKAPKLQRLYPVRGFWRGGTA